MRPSRLVFFALSVLAGPAAAQGTPAYRVAVLLPQLRPAGAAELQAKFHEALIKGVARAGEVMPAAEVRARLEGAPELLGCTGGPCIAAAARRLGVNRLVAAEVEIMGKDYTIRVRPFDAGGAELAAIPEEKCDICTLREATRAGERAADRAVAALDKGHAPAAAPAAAVAPAASDDDPGLRLPPSPPPPRAPSPPAAPPPVTASSPAGPAAPAPGGAATSAAPALAAAPASERRSSPLRLGAYAAFAVAGAAIVGMIPFAYFASREGPAGTDSSYTCGAANKQYSCPSIYSGNTAPAVTLGILGAAAAVTGGVLLYLDRGAAHRAATVTAAPLPGGGVAVAGSVEF